MHHEILQPGITGFWMTGDRPTPELSRKSISSAAHAATRAAGWTIVAKQWAKHQNYHQFEITKQASRLIILFNIAYPLIAFSIQIPLEDQQTDFVDAEDLAVAFRSASNFIPLSQEMLITSLNAEDLKHLNTAELDQVKYWQPETIGELVFNHWD